MTGPTQLWDVLPHLCGLPTALARRGLKMTLQVFVDESGKTERPVFVMAAYVGRSAEWAKLSDKWRAVLDEPPRMASFHMAQAAFDGEVRRLPALMQIVEDHVLTQLTVTISQEEFTEIVVGRLEPLHDTPYLLAFTAIIFMAAQWQVHRALMSQWNLSLTNRFT